MITKSHRWQKTALAAAAIALLGLSGNGAYALSLGRITVQSALGEPLRAEIDVPDINAEEAASLRANVASPDAFVAAGMEYNPAMTSLQATLQRRADGRAYIRLASDRPINDPFVDMILEANWSSGRIVRDYTLLLDPPALRQTAPTPTLPQTQGGISTPTIPKAPTDNTRPAPAPKSGVVAKPAAPAAPAAAPVPAKAATKPQGETAKQVTVKEGDNASKIAAKVKAANVSLDQMLVALMRANPDAFVNNNLNRIRAGAVLDVPTSEQAQSVSKPDASQMVVAQSKDFNDFRGKLAANAPKVALGNADRKVNGTVEAKVEDKKPASAVPDKLTLSQGSVKAKADEAKIAKERADKDAAARAAEIAKNISDLNKLSSANKPVAPAASAPATPSTSPATASKAASAPSVAAVTTPVIAPAASAVVEPAAPVAAASAPQAAPPAPKKVAPAPVVVPVPEEPGLVDQLLEDPVIPVAAVGLLAALGGFAFYRMRQRRKNAAQVDSSFLESRLQPDSFFGASGGQRVDTNNEGPNSNSSMVYSASQLDAADDVDPVAEADVYLAYGRDLQAEEILKEAVRTNPSRLAIHTKLLEIFAKRRDVKSFENSAGQAFKLTGSASPEWSKICELGLSIDPENPLYQPGNNPTESAFASLDSDSTAAFSRSTIAQSASPDFSESKAVDLDLDLDFSADDEPASAINDITGSNMATPANAATETVKMEAEDSGHGMSLDFDISGPAELEVSPALPEISLSMDGIGQDTSPAAEPLQFDATNSMPVEPMASAPAPGKDTGMLEFDLGSLSLDLESPPEQPSEAPTTTGEDPLETKLALADEFISIGDDDGARALIEEVIAEAKGDMRAKAQLALANLS